MKKFMYLFASVALCALTLSGCKHGDEPTPSPEPTPDPTPEVAKFNAVINVPADSIYGSVVYLEVTPQDSVSAAMDYMVIRLSKAAYEAYESDQAVAEEYVEKYKKYFSQYYPSAAAQGYTWADAYAYQGAISGHLDGMIASTDYIILALAWDVKNDKYIGGVSKDFTTTAAGLSESYYNCLANDVDFFTFQYQGKGVMKCTPADSTYDDYYVLDYISETEFADYQSYYSTQYPQYWAAPDSFTVVDYIYLYNVNHDYSSYGIEDFSAYMADKGVQSFDIDDENDYYETNYSWSTNTQYADYGAGQGTYYYPNGTYLAIAFIYNGGFYSEDGNDYIFSQTQPFNYVYGQAVTAPARRLVGSAAKTKGAVAAHPEMIKAFRQIKVNHMANKAFRLF